MSSVSAPVITKTEDGIVYVSIEFVPDRTRFENITDVIKVFEKRTWDAAMWCSKAKVYFNTKLIEVSSLEEYAKMHLGEVPVAKITRTAWM
jgi:DNA topoisomerase-2